MESPKNHSAGVLERAVAALIAAADALPMRDDLGEEVASIERAAARGYFYPDEEELIRQRFNQYLALRTAMIEIHAELKAQGWAWLGDRQLPVFVVAFAAGCLLDRADRYLVELATSRSVVWKKLDEEDVLSGIPRKTFTHIYRESSRPRALARLLVAHDYYRRHRAEIHALDADPRVGPAVALLRAEEPWMDIQMRQVLKRRARYRWFSFLRRHRSAWKKVTFGIFEASGRAVAELAVPGVKPLGAPKRIDARLRAGLLPLLQPGDVVVTRHDDAVSNLFLPGFWPHAALFLGGRDQLEQLAVALPDAAHGGGPWFLEAKKDGVRVRPVEETLQVDALMVLRPPLSGDELAHGLRRALQHTGKPYDFLFDFRTADRLVCTEVVYRGYHGAGPVKFELREVGGRLCLPAEVFLDQALSCGFEVVAAAGLGGSEVLTGEAARDELAATRPSRPDLAPRSAPSP